MIKDETPSDAGGHQSNIVRSWFEELTRLVPTN